MKRSGCLGLSCACALAALASGCLSDDDSSSGGTSSYRTTASTSSNAEDLLKDLDGWRLAFVSKRRPGDRSPRIYSAEADGTDLRAIDHLRGDKQTPNWSPDGERIAFRWDLAAETNTPLAIIDADGSNFVNLSKTTGLKGWAPSWSPDGNKLVAAPDRSRYTAEPLRDGRGRIARATDHRGRSRGAICPVVARRRLDRIHLRRRRRFRHLQGSARRVRSHRLD